MKKLLFSLFLIIYSISLQAQKKSDGIAGEYFLRGVMEVASGFKLYKDSTFQFYFSYGALDRFATGSWTIAENNTVSLSTKEKPMYDFALVKTAKTESDSVTIKITDINKNLLRHVYCTLHDNEVAYEQVTDKNGEIKFPKQYIDSINLIFEFAPERNSKVCIELLDRENNYFEFKFEPWLAEVFFDKISLHLGDEKLRGTNPLLDGDNYLYLKNGK